MLNRFFNMLDMGRQWGTEEDLMPLSMGSQPFGQPRILAWELPEMFKMVKLIWKPKSDLQGTKQRGVLENEDAPISLSGNLKML